MKQLKNKPNMKKEIEWSEPDGCQGGERGLTFNLETQAITKWNGEVEPLSMDNISEVEWCIKMNINSINEKIGKILIKLEQTETIHIPIPNGYKISEPLSEARRVNSKNKLSNLTEELEWLKSISLKVE